MQRMTRIIAALAIFAGVAEAQAPTKGFRAEFLSSIGRIEDKVLKLADAIPQSKWDWKPEGARSVCQVLMHMAQDKYFFGGSIGLQMPAELRSDACPADRSQVKVHIAKAFKAFNDAVIAMPETAADEQVTLFGRPNTKRQLLLETAEHAGEHLGQLIAYARMNGVVPPWSAK
jgi:uncharacterized damage-inducible protein DinB